MFQLKQPIITDYGDGDVDSDFVELQDADGTLMKFFCGVMIGWFKLHG